ncbi:MAG: hypothetical protein AB8I08_20565 [Sandaracinaceae bacterium]
MLSLNKKRAWGVVAMLCVAASLALASPSPAEAQDDDGGYEMLVLELFVAMPASLFAGAHSLSVLGYDLAILGSGRWLTPGASWLNLITGALSVAGGLTVALLAGRNDLYTIVGVAAMAYGGLAVLIGSLSFAFWEDEPPPDSSGFQVGSLGFAPLDGGGMLTVGGRL